jgi:hypothetical protein
MAPDASYGAEGPFSECHELIEEMRRIYSTDEDAVKVAQLNQQFAEARGWGWLALPGGVTRFGCTTKFWNSWGGRHPGCHQLVFVVIIRPTRVAATPGCPGGGRVAAWSTVLAVINRCFDCEMTW